MSDEHKETEDTTAEDTAGAEENTGAEETAAGEEAAAELTEVASGAVDVEADEESEGSEDAAAAEPEEAAGSEDAAATEEPVAEEPVAEETVAAEDAPAAEETAAPDDAPEPETAADDEAPAAAEGDATSAQHSYDELKGMTVVQMREIAEGLGDLDALHGYTTMHKEELLVALCKAQCIEAHEHHEVVGIDKVAVKAKIRALKQQRDALVEAKDSKQLKVVRRRIRSLKRKIHKATV